MNLAINALKLAYRSVSFKVRGHHADPTHDYNYAADTYDEYYYRHLKPCAQALFDKLPIAPGARVLDLACGTGFFSHRLAEAVGSFGHVTAVDRSSGMLSCNKHGAQARGFENISFLESEALQAMSQIRSASLDGVVCGWALCYMKRDVFRSEVERVLKPGGFLGIIDNRASSLKALSDLFRKVLLGNPAALAKNVDVDLPRDAANLVKTLCRGSLQALESWDGEVSVSCSNGDQAIEYVVKSAAAAGFIDALDPDLKARSLADIARAFDEAQQRGRPIAVSHDYCTLIARRVA